jgi:hypothetical protein
MDVSLGEELEPEMADEMKQIVDVDPAAYLKPVDIRHDEGCVYPPGGAAARECVEEERDEEEEVAAEPACPKGAGTAELPIEPYPGAIAMIILGCEPQSSIT